MKKLIYSFFLFPLPFGSRDNSDDVPLAGYPISGTKMTVFFECKESSMGKRSEKEKRAISLLRGTLRNQ